MNDPKIKEVSFEDRFGLLVDIEYSNRKSNSLKRLIKGAGFDQPETYMEISLERHADFVSIGMTIPLLTACHSA